MSYLPNKHFVLKIAIILPILILFASCKKENAPSKFSLGQPAYEIYVPYWGPKDALNKITSHADRLANMQVKTIFLSPLQPVSKLMKLGSLGSPYAISHFDSIQSGFGNEEDLKKLVQTFHEYKITVFMDWYPALMGRDNPMKIYSLGDADTLAFNEYNFPYTDVLAIDYSGEAVNKMTQTISNWVNKYQLDGIRVHHDKLVPTKLYSGIKSATNCQIIHSGQKTENLQPFDCVMNSTLRKLMIDIKKGTIQPKEFVDQWVKNYEQDHCYINDVVNYQNMSELSQLFSAYGHGIKEMTILNFLHHGIPAIPSGIEIPWSGNRNMLQSNPLNFPGRMNDDFYRTLFILGNQNKAFRSGNNNPIRIIETSNPNVYGFEKKQDAHTIVFIANFSGDKQEFVTNENVFNLNEYATKKTVTIRKDQKVKLAGFQYILLSNV